jgi:serine phosphatase RsbU (regulator of sigma subunit)
MARRPGVRSKIAPPSLALALSFLICLTAPSVGAFAKKPPEAGEPAAAAAEPQPESHAERAAQRKAERLARHEERAASDAPAAGQAAPGATSGKSGAAAQERAARHGERAAGRAQRAAERAARHGGREDGSATGTPTRNAAAVTPAGSGKSAGEREERKREHEARKREREEERRRTGRETKKERLAREAREASEELAAGNGASPSASAGAAQVAGSLAAAAGIAPAAAPEAKGGADAAIASERAARSTGARRPGHVGRAAGRGNGAAIGGGELPAVVPATLAASSTRAGAPAVHDAKPQSAAAHRGSPLVTTVTRIIGVIPAALWLLIGALALAALAFAASSRLLARRARRFDRQRRALLEDVGLLQAALLPELPDRLGAVITSAAYRPASGPGAGGDFYDVLALPDGLVGVLVGDVSGHGREALPHTTLLRYTLRAYLEAGLSPRESLRAAAPALERQLGDSFATVVLARYDPRARLLSYSCAGHPHPLLSGLDPDRSIIAASAPPIGTGGPTGTRETVVCVPGAAVAAFYTDGVIEARTSGELYGQRRLARALEGLEAECGGVEASALLDRVAEQTDRRPDDMAACILGIAGGERRPFIVAEQIVLDGRESEAKRARRFLLAAGAEETEIGRALSAARAIAADHGSALVELHLGEGAPRLTVTHDNVAPLRARALARTQEVAL